MKLPILLLLVLFAACTGTLTDEQRKKIKAERENSQIRKITEAQITEAAFALGRSLAAKVNQQDRALNNSGRLDSLAQAEQIEIFVLQKSSDSLRGIEKQILEAYLENTAGQSDNVQKMGADSLLYTNALFREHPDGSTEFLKALAIRMTRKQVVLTIKD